MRLKLLADDPEEEDSDGDRDGNDEAGDERAGPVAQEEEEDDAGEDEADEDGVADAGDGLADELGLVVERREMDAGGELGLEGGISSATALATWTVLDGGLARDVEQNRGCAVGRDRGVDGHGGGHDLGDVGYADGDSGGRGLDDERAELGGVVSLRADEAEDELMVGFVEAGRVDDVGGLDGVDEIE